MLRSAMIAAAAVALAASGATAAGKAPKPAPGAAQGAQAPSVVGYGREASYRTGPIGKGYSARDRHIADCLATYRGYDPATDKVVVRPGVARRCEL